ncbi:MAG: hypothetical protein ACK411_07880, partial [Exiguobacterium mexicanum]
MVNWNETKAFLQERMNGTPEIGLILGSGLGVLADLVRAVRQVGVDFRQGVDPLLDQAARAV